MERVMRLEKLKACLVGSETRGEAASFAGALFEHIERHGGSWENLFDRGSSHCDCSEAGPRSECLQDLSRIRKASRYTYFLSMSEREELLLIADSLENGSPQPVGDTRSWLNEIYLRTGI